MQRQILSIVAIATFLCVNFGISTGQQPQSSLQLFSKVPPDDTFSIILKASRAIVPEVHDEVLAANYLCNNGGVWLAYPKHNYTFGAWLLANPGCMQYWYLFNPISSVYLLESSKDTTIPSINLFPEVWWQGLEGLATYTGNQDSYNGAFNSIIVTGYNMVTFYSEPNYQGRSVCLRPEADSTVIFEGEMETVGFPIGEVKSFHFGCFPSANVMYSKRTQNNPIPTITKKNGIDKLHKK